MAAVLGAVKFEHYAFNVFVSQGGAYYLQAMYPDKDIATGAVELQKTRKWLLSIHMTKSELVQTAFKCVLTSMEHRGLEGFTYRGKRVFGPHFDVDALWEICAQGRHDYRGKT